MKKTAKKIIRKSLTNLKEKAKKNTKAKEDDGFSEDLVFEEELMYADDEEMPELDLSDDE
jgi:hypothetical protein